MSLDATNQSTVEHRGASWHTPEHFGLLRRGSCRGIQLSIHMASFTQEDPPQAPPHSFLFTRLFTRVNLKVKEGKKMARWGSRWRVEVYLRPMQRMQRGQGARGNSKQE